MVLTFQEFLNKIDATTSKSKNKEVLEIKY